MASKVIDRLRSWLPVSRSTLEDVRRTEREQVEAPLRKQIKALESLLDIGDDPDAKLEGLDRQSLFRQTSMLGKKESNRDFPAFQRQKVLRLSHMVYGLRGDGKNLIDLEQDFIIGEPLKPVVEVKSDKALQKELDAIWDDERNNLRVEHERLTQTFLIEGELFMTADLSPDDGHLELGYLEPETVDRVLQDGRWRDAFVETRAPEETKSRRWFVLDNLEESIQIEPIEDGEYRYLVTDTDASGATAIKCHGLCFAWFDNRPKGATRGRGDLAAVLDYIDISDELLYSQAERERLLRFFLLHLTMEDVRTPKEAKKRLRELGLLTPPENPIVLATNSKTTAEIKAPPQTNDPSNLMEQLSVAIYGSLGFPETWRGSGKANLATARAMDLVPQRRLRRKQRSIKNRWKRLLTVSLELKRRAKSIRLTAPYKFRMVAFDVGGKDKQRGASIMKDTATSLQTMIAAEAIKVEAANEIFLQAAEEAGYIVSQENAGLPEQASKDLAREMEARMAQLVSQRTQQDDGPTPSDDRERDEERLQ